MWQFSHEEIIFGLFFNVFLFLLIVCHMNRHVFEYLLAAARNWSNKSYLLRLRKYIHRWLSHLRDDDEMLWKIFSCQKIYDIYDFKQTMNKNTASNCVAKPNETIFIDFKDVNRLNNLECEKFHRNTLKTKIDKLSIDSVDLLQSENRGNITIARHFCARETHRTTKLGTIGLLSFNELRNLQPDEIENKNLNVNTGFSNPNTHQPHVVVRNDEIMILKSVHLQSSSFLFHTNSANEK